MFIASAKCVNTLWQVVCALGTKKESGKQSVWIAFSLLLTSTLRACALVEGLGSETTNFSVFIRDCAHSECRQGMYR